MPLKLEVLFCIYNAWLFVDVISNHVCNEPYFSMFLLICVVFVPAGFDVLWLVTSPITLES